MPLLRAAGLGSGPISPSDSVSLFPRLTSYNMKLQVTTGPFVRRARMRLQHVKFDGELRSHGVRFTAGGAEGMVALAPTALHTRKPSAGGTR